MALPNPNWDLHLLKPKMSLWEIIALTFDVEPNAVAKWDDLKSRTYWQPGKPMYERLEALISVASDEKSTPFSSASYYNIDARSDVRLVEYVVWALSVGWKLPERLAALANQKEARRQVSKWPWGDYENNNLRMLEKAVEKYWANWKDGDAEHINKTVQGYLIDQGMDADPASQVATLIRPDSLKKGGRPKAGS